ncbi:MAG: hypothetical protein J6S67_08560 [Methanobrevibacter sp.]|nr:hypothetical protein [Methanobrevibacter sp.]
MKKLKLTNFENIDTSKNLIWGSTATCRFTIDNEDIEFIDREVDSLILHFADSTIKRHISVNTHSFASQVKVYDLYAGNKKFTAEIIIPIFENVGGTRKSVGNLVYIVKNCKIKTLSPIDLGFGSDYQYWYDIESFLGKQEFKFIPAPPCVEPADK